MSEQPASDKPIRHEYVQGDPPPIPDGYRFPWAWLSDEQREEVRQIVKEEIKAVDSPSPHAAE
jgi:hypothetical protein